MDVLRTKIEKAINLLCSRFLFQYIAIYKFTDDGSRLRSDTDMMIPRPNEFGINHFISTTLDPDRFWLYLEVVGQDEECKKNYAMEKFVITRYEKEYLGLGNTVFSPSPILYKFIKGSNSLAFFDMIRLIYCFNKKLISPYVL